MKNVFTLIIALCFNILTQAQILPVEATYSTRSVLDKEHSALFDRMMMENTTLQRVKEPVKTETVSETDVNNSGVLYTLHSSIKPIFAQLNEKSAGYEDSISSDIEERQVAILARMTKEIDTLKRANIPAATQNVSKSVTVKAGGLFAALTETELGNVTNLTVYGSIDARDFKTMRDNLPLLAVLDLSGVTIEAYKGTDGTYSTSSVSYPANTIPDNALYIIGKYKTSIETITLPLLINAIGNDAFVNCYNLTSVNISSTITSIGNSAFWGCSSLTSIYIPSTVVYIGRTAFSACNCLITVDKANPNYSSIDGILFNKDQSILIQYPAIKPGAYHIPFTVKEVGDQAFFGCRSLTSVSIPSSVHSLGSQAFSYCSGLPSIYIPSSVITMGVCAFLSSSCLITVDTNNSYFSSSDGLLFNNDKTNLIQSPTSKQGSYNIPASVTSIGLYAFQDCIGLSSITIPSSVTAIGSYTFNNCTGLKSIYALSSSVINLSTNDNVFKNINKTTCILYVPSGSKIAYQSAIQWNDFQNIVEMTANSTSKSISVTAGGLSGALTTVEKTTLTDLTIVGTLDARDFVTLRDFMPKLAVLNISGTSIVAYTGTGGTIGTDSYTYPANEIPQNAFFNSISISFNRTLTSINLPNKLTSIGIDAFEFCPLISVDIPSSVTSIKDYAFFGCRVLASVSLSSSVTSIGNGAFAHLYGPIIVAANSLSYSSQNGILFDKSKTTLIQCSTSQTGSYTIPSTVSTIGAWAFYYCSNLTEISLPLSVTSIGSFSFDGTQISTINIPSSVLTIDKVNCSFRQFSGSINVDPNNLNYSSQEGVLFNKDKSLLIQCPITKAGDYSVPASVSSINRSAFENCKSLTSINIPALVSTIGAWAFFSCTGLTSFTFPSSITSIGSYALYTCRNLTAIQIFKTEPVDLSAAANVFLSVDQATCVLYVPRGSKSAYQSAGQWKDFINIVEMDTNSTSKSVSVTSGGLSNALTATEKSTLTDLTITGTLDARDFVTLRDDMPRLAILNISGTSILSYSGMNGTMGENYSNYAENTIPQQAFYTNSSNTGKRSLNSIILPSFITAIGDYAFGVCDSLTSVKIPSFVTSIGSFSFFGCRGLSSITISSSVTTIGNSAFYDFSGLILVDADNPNYSSGDGILFDKNRTTLIQCPTTIIGNYAIPLTVSSVGSYAFSGCSDLTLISIPFSVTSIGFNAFYYCSGQLNVDAANPYYSSSDGVLFNKNKTNFIHFPNSINGSYTIPSSVSSVSSYAFSGCNDLTSITIPTSISSMGENAFYYCGSLPVIKTINSEPLVLSSNPFAGVNQSTCILQVPVGSLSKYKLSLYWKDFRNIVEINSQTGTSNLNNTSGIIIYASSHTVFVCFTENPKVARIAIYDRSGRLIISKVCNEELAALPVSGSGVYIVKVEAGNRTQTKKIIIL